MKRIKKTFAMGPVFAAYLTAGDGGLDHNFEIAKAYLKAGANLLEIGVPFSDPVADGPVIQAASERALKQGICLKDILALVEKIRAISDVPIILMSYCNPIIKALDKGFLAEAKVAGVDGLLVVDMPLEEAKQYHKSCVEHDIAPIMMLAPNTPGERISKIAKQTKGFIYYACRAGTTGVKNGLPKGFAEKIAEIKSYTQVPVLVGFGIATREVAQQVLQYADGFVVASLFVAAMAEGKNELEIEKLARSINPIGVKI